MVYSLLKLLLFLFLHILPGEQMTAEIKKLPNNRCTLKKPFVACSPWPSYIGFFFFKYTLT